MSSFQPPSFSQSISQRKKGWRFLIYYIKYTSNTPFRNFSAFMCLEKGLKQINRTIEVVRDVKHHHETQETRLLLQPCFVHVNNAFLQNNSDFIHSDSFTKRAQRIKQLERVVQSLVVVRLKPCVTVWWISGYFFHFC